MRVEWKEGYGHGPLIPAKEPKEAGFFVGKKPDYYFTGEGTAKDSGSPIDPKVEPWLKRFNTWRGAFEQQISPNVRKYWALYRNFDDGPLPGPNQEWRDRTVIPQCYKVIETRLPRLIMGQFGGREWFTVEGREGTDEMHEETVRTLMATTLTEIGKDRPDRDLLLILMDAMRYGQIMGHVWLKPFWRKSTRPLKTQMPLTGTNGKITWQPIELTETTYDGVDLDWLAISDLAIDTSRGDRKWSIERVQTSLEALKREHETFKELNGMDLYDPAALAALETSEGAASGGARESFEEPRHTEGWPLTEQEYAGDPTEHVVELWLCYDNVNRKMTKIVNRRVVLDHGLTNTPDGLDPYIGVPAVPIPGRAYGESILHYIGPLAMYQTRLARARADEILLNIWQQFVIREGALRSSQFLFRPGGVMTIEGANPDRPLSDYYGILPRRPVFQEAWTEEGYRQQQGESTAGADQLSQGIEATQKSRDVAATEVQQRVQQAALRFQMENLYLEVSLKGPLLRKHFDLLRQNMTQARSFRILNKEVTVDLTQLQQPIDIIVGGGIKELTKAERFRELDQMIKLGDSPKWGPWVKEREVLNELFINYGRKDPSRFIRTEDEKQQYEMEQMAMQMGAMPPPDGGGRPGTPPRERVPGATQPLAGGTAERAASSGSGGPEPVGGGVAEESAPASGTLLAEI